MTGAERRKNPRFGLVHEKENGWNLQRRFTTHGFSQKYGEHYSILLQIMQ